MALPDLSFIDDGRLVEVEAIDTGRSSCEFTLAPGPVNFDDTIGENEEESLHGKPVDDVIELDERLRDLKRYVEFARMAFQQRGLQYPFEVTESGESLAIAKGQEELALQAAELSRIVRQGNPEASKFEKRAFRAAQKLIGGWGVCVGSPRETKGMGAEKSVRHYRSLLLPHESGPSWPADFGPNGDHGADGLLILGRGWGGPIVFYQSKNSGFDLEVYPNELGRVPSIAEVWFGKKINIGRRIIPVLALNTVLTIELKEKIYEERGEMSGAHILDAVDILASERVSATHCTRECGCIVL